MLENSSVRVVTTVDTRTLLKYQRHIEPLPSTLLKESKVIFDPNQLTGVAVVSASGLRAVASAHASGTSHTSASSTATTSATMDPVERFLRGLRLRAAAFGLIRLRV